MSNSRTTMSINESFNEYYSLKNKYESDFKKDKQKIIKNKFLSWKEKRNEFKQLKPKCINCKRPVGTIFSIKHSGKDNEDYRELKALCGSLTEPCNLNININTGTTYNILQHIKELENDIEEYKRNIIEYKNKLLFGYTNTESAIENFEKYKDAINDTSFLLNINYERLFEIIDNNATNEKITKLKEECYLLINQIKNSIKDFNTTTNIQFARDAVEIYVNQMSPKIDELLNLKYNVNLVEFDESEGVYRLIQKKYDVVDLEDKYVEPTILSFNYGDIYTGKPKTGKTQRKTKMLGEEEKIVQPVESQSQTLSQSELLTYNDDGTITWKQSDYENLWNNLPIPYRKALMSDKEWLLETMNKYVENKKQNKPNEFVNPSNLIIPPQILDDGTYDFGNKVYNDIFNKYDKSYQKTLLTLYSEKNGIRNYDMMIDAIGNIVKQELGFNLKYL